VSGESVTPPCAAGWYPHHPDSKEYGYWDGSTWRPDVMAAMNRMHNYSPPKSFRRWALARVGEFVPGDETVERIATGTSYFHRWGRSTSEVVTDRRLLLLIGRRHDAEVREDQSGRVGAIPLRPLGATSWSRPRRGAHRWSPT
jgi:hypothetical protein